MFQTSTHRTHGPPAPAQPSEASVGIFVAPKPTKAQNCPIRGKEKVHIVMRGSRANPPLIRLIRVLIRPGLATLSNTRCHSTYIAMV